MLLGRREAPPVRMWDRERDPSRTYGSIALWSRDEQSPFLRFRVSSCCYKTYLRYTGATKRSGCSLPRHTGSSTCSPTPPITTVDRCYLPMGTQTAPVSDGNLITVATVRAVDWTRNHSCCKKLTSAAQVLTFWCAYPPLHVSGWVSWTAVSIPCHVHGPALGED